MISVIIATKDRQEKLIRCVGSILKNSTSKSPMFEVIVVDQSKRNNSKHFLDQIKTDRVSHYFFPKASKSLALNFGVARASGNIIAFTDDDCEARSTWLTNIQKTFKKYPGVSGVFGKVEPYEPRANKGRFCPSTILRKKLLVVSKPCRHWQKLGYGNNMAFRKKVFKETFFRSWLGPGSWGGTAEDAWFALRLLTSGHSLMYEPKIVVSHNRWLNYRQKVKQRWLYLCGQSACYGYYFFEGVGLAKRVVVADLKDLYFKLREILKRLLFLKLGSGLLLLAVDLCGEFVFKARGLAVALYYFHRERV